jgi:hypothetical protein
MKTWVAYGLVVLGVPVFVGLLVGGLAAVLFGVAFLRYSPNAQRALLPYMEVFNGFGAAIAGAFLFRLFGLTPSLLVTLIMAGWVSFYFIAYRQPLTSLFSWLAGILVGWLTLAKMVAPA